MKKKKRFNRKKWLKKVIMLVVLFIVGFLIGIFVYLIGAKISNLYNVESKSPATGKDAVTVISAYTKSAKMETQVTSKQEMTSESETSTVSCQDSSDIAEVTQISKADNSTTISTVSSTPIVAQPSFEEEHADEIKLLSAIIFAEAGNVAKAYPNENADLWQQNVGYVVMNRVDSPNFPDSIRKVLYQKGQYDTATKKRVENGYVSEQSTKNAVIVLKNYYNNEIPIPRNVVFQAEFPQGSKIYDHIGNTYFCYQ